MLDALEDRDTLFLFFHFSLVTILFEVLLVKYILLCYLTGNMWWGSSFEWFGAVLN